MLLVGVQGILTPIAGIWLSSSYLVGAFTGIAGLIVQVVFILAFRLDSNYSEYHDTTRRLVYGQQFIYMGAALSVGLASLANWKQKKSLTLRD